MFAVACMGCDEMVKKFEELNDDYSKIMVQVRSCIQACGAQRNAISRAAGRFKRPGRLEKPERVSLDVSRCAECLLARSTTSTYLPSLGNAAVPLGLREKEHVRPGPHTTM